MATYTDARQLSAAQRARAQRLKHGPTSIETAQKEAAELAMAEAKKLTSGTISQAALTLAGHPFARNRALGRLGRLGERIGTGGASLFQSMPLLPINKQTGALERGWRVFRYKSGNGGYVYRMQNIAPEAKYVLAPDGTKNMVARGFWQELNRRTIPKIRQKNLGSYRAALKG